VAAHIVKNISGFKVYYGPIRAKDLSAYLDAGMKATPKMRVMTFPLIDRAVLIPIEFVAAVKPFLIGAPILYILAGIGGPAGFWANTAHYGLFAVIALLSAILGGAVLNPLLLPYLPGRAFSVKGFSIGIIIALILLYLREVNLHVWSGALESLAWLLIIPAVAGYLAMNFTGCSTYTSLSGVKKEMRWALPTQIIAGAGGLVIWLASRLIS
jgi:acetyl-CoA decarbonylase/synthase complex subunit gamma